MGKFAIWGVQKNVLTFYIFKVEGLSKIGFDQKFEVQQPIEQRLGDLGKRLLFQSIEMAFEEILDVVDPG